MSFHHLPDDVGTMMAFVVLAALAKSPMTTANVSRALLISPKTASNRLEELEKLGWIVQRKKDSKWVMRVLLAPIKAPVPGEPSAPSDYPVLGHGFRRPVDLPDETSKLEAPKVEAVPKEAPEWRSASERLAEKWSLPLRLKGLAGEIGVGKLAPCIKCGLGTPLRYGDVSLCPKCSRALESEH